MITDCEISKLTKRAKRLDFKAETFEDERILSLMLEVVEGRGIIVAATKQRKMKFRFGKCSKRVSK